MLALRAADDPTDELALVAALRSAALRLQRRRAVRVDDAAAGRGRSGATPPDALADHPVADGDRPRALDRRADRRGATPADLLAAIVDERRLLDVALDGPDARDVWRRVRYVIDQARAWSDAGGHGLRRYLAWARLQASESRIADTILPEHDHDAVRIMTIHAAKGLEFPITVVTGLTTKPQRRAADGVVWHNGTWTLAGKHGDEVYDDFKPIDEQMSDAERRRLLYVACTRAVDHLVVSLHRVPPKPTPPSNRQVHERRRCWPAAGAADADGRRRDAGARPGPFTVARVAPDELDVGRRRGVGRRTRRARSPRPPVATDGQRHPAGRGSGRGSTPAPATDEGLRKDAVDLELPPWQRGRYGTAVGRAVHGMLQFCDLARRPRHRPTSPTRQCAAEGIIGARGDGRGARPLGARGADRARAAVEPNTTASCSSPPRSAIACSRATSTCWCAPPAGSSSSTTRPTSGGPAPTAPNGSPATAGSWPPTRVALEQVLGEPIVGGVLVHCRTIGDAEQIELDDWAAAIDDLRARDGSRRADRVSVCRRPASTTLW